MTITKAFDLIGEPNFDALLKTWETDHQCPLPLVDLLLEYGLDQQAEVARWAATEEYRKEYKTGILSKPYPTPYKDVFYWFPRSSFKYADCLPEDKLEQFGSLSQTKFPYILIALLDKTRIKKRETP